MTDTQIASTENPSAPSAAPPSAPVESATPATPAAPAPTPEQLAAQKAADEAAAKEKARKDRIERLNDKTRASAAAFREKTLRKEAEKKAREAEAQRQADLGRLSQAEAWEKVKGDPAKALEYLESIGLTAEQLSQAALRKGTPEEIIARAQELARQEAKRILDEERAERKKQDEARMAQEELANQQRALRSFVGMTLTAKNEDKSHTYPALTFLYAHVPHVLAQKAESLTKTAIQKGYHLEDHEIAELLEEASIPEYNKKRAEFLSGNSPPQSGSTPSSQPAANGTAARAPVVTNETGAGVSLPEDFDKYSDKEKTAWYAKRYNQIVESRKR